MKLPRRRSNLFRTLCPCETITVLNHKGIGAIGKARPVLCTAPIEKFGQLKGIEKMNRTQEGKTKVDEGQFKQW